MHISALFIESGRDVTLELKLTKLDLETWGALQFIVRFIQFPFHQTDVQRQQTASGHSNELSLRRVDHKRILLKNQGA